MARLPFDQTVTFVRGPAQPDAGTTFGPFPCRLVLQENIEAVGIGGHAVPAWLTCEAYAPIGVWQDGVFSVQPGLADRVCVPSSAPASYFVFYCDRITWRNQVPYYRAYLFNLP